ncbi:acetyl-CoA C-acetyltransferase [Granulosicoccaceae sp. 1_MG-2023]|nr:acetyl-CoA C-acetyltransferase [Granulosicoccaceae sp. 1_MG-2023]
MSQHLRSVVICGAARIPFCRSNTAYSELSNLDMLGVTLRGLVARTGLQGERLGELSAGAVITHSKDWNLAREAVLSSGLSPETPGLTLQQACGTSLQGALGSAAKIAAGQMDCAIAAGSDTTSDVPVVFGRRFAQRLARLSRAKTLQQRLGLLRGMSLRELKPIAPSVNEPRTLMSMGEHCERMAREWEISRQAQDQLALQSHQKAAAAYAEGFFDDLLVPCEGVWRDNNLRPDASMESLAALRTAYDKSAAATLTAGNSTPLTDGAAALLLASEDWARERDLPVLARLTAFETAAVDYVGGEGLLMAPTIAVARMLQRTGLGLQDFDFYEIHEAFAAQVLCTLKAWESPAYCRDRLGLDAPLGAIDQSHLNIKGSSLAIGHPFAATGARVTATMAKLLHQKGRGRGLISVCTAGGMGVTAILEAG